LFDDVDYAVDHAFVLGFNLSDLHGLIVSLYISRDLLHQGYIDKN
jgi:hypothetical protein